MKKLNKPPVSKEQQALEEYVGSLLSEKSNVLPIETARRKKSLEVTKIDADVVTDGAGPITKKSKPAKTPIDLSSPESIEAQSFPADKISNSDGVPVANKPDLVKKTTGQNKDKADLRCSDKSLNDGVVERNKVNSSFDQTESEAEELAAWTALLAREQNELAPQPNEDNISAAGKKSEQKGPANIIGDDDRNDKLIGHRNNHRPPAQTKSDHMSSAQQLKEITSPGIEPKSGFEKSSAPLKDSKQELKKPIDALLPAKQFDDPRLAGVQKLLSKISAATLSPAQALSSEKVKPVDVPTATPAMTAAAAEATFVTRKAKKTKDILPEIFQTLIFQVGKLPLAVPLLKLGGIVKFSEQDLTALVGTPSWFMGLMPNDRGNLMVIDSQKFLMPEQVGVDKTQKAYEYLILLDDSQWALACHSVGDAKNLTTNDIRWSAKSSRRPWFGGMVVDYMSALIEVDELINMLTTHISE